MATSTDWHLVVFGAEGNVVVAEGTPEGYREKTRLQALDGSGYTWPSFADGQIFVRNLKEMASVSVVAGSAASIASAGPGAGAGAATEFGKFVRQVETAEGKAAMLDEFMNRNEQFPLVEGAYAHFVYRGDVEEIAITGTMIETGNPEPMERIAGTDFYYRTYELEPGGRWESQFNRHFDERITDPLNPKTAPGRRIRRAGLPGRVQRRRARHAGDLHVQERVARKRARGFGIPPCRLPGQ
jgi:hypothetical protein